MRINEIHIISHNVSLHHTLVEPRGCPALWMWPPRRLTCLGERTLGTLPSHRYCSKKLLGMYANRSPWEAAEGLSPQENLLTESLLFMDESAWSHFSKGTGLCWWPAKGFPEAW